MKLDTGLLTPSLREAAEHAQLAETMGFDALWTAETSHDPFFPLVMAAERTEHIKLGTAIAVAFPRSPMISAQIAWEIAQNTDGRFRLGLGSQVRGHIVRRFGLAYRPPGPWMRDYVQAVRAVWACWQHRTTLDFESEHYRLSLMVPLFDPGPIEHPDIPIHLAAVNPTMCRIAGEVADGLRPHPVCTPRYLREVMRPALAAGARAAGRAPERIAVAMKPLVCAAPDEATLAEKVRDVRARVAFYASTPGYRAAFEAHGLGDLAAELASLAREQRWEEMPPRISDEVLHTYAVVGTYADIGRKLVERYRGLVTDVEFSIPAGTERERGILRELVQEVRREAA